MNRRVSFPNTRWTRIFYAGDPAHPRVQAAFAELFQLYWYPVFAFLRRWGFDRNDAEDLTQAFFLYAYEHHTFSKVDRAKGRFRTFVLGCLRNFVNDDHRRETAVKRGGGAPVVEIDALTAEARYSAEPLDPALPPDKLFEQQLALEVFNGAMKELEGEESVNERQAKIFDALRGYLDEDVAPESYEVISLRLEMPVGTLKSHASRFRKRLRDLLRERAGHIVANDDEVMSELQALEEAL